MFELPYDLIPVKFHKYTSSTRNRIFEIDTFNKTWDHNTAIEIHNQIYQIEKELLDKFNRFEIQCREDNKIVFECLIKGVKVCYGFYDGNFSVGLDYYDENEMI
jgi:hypothetical protein